MAMKLAYVHIIILCLIFSCEERIEKPLQTVDPDLLVVEAVLTNENRNHKITLTHPYQLLNGSAKAASGATVFIVEGKNTVYNAIESPAGSGEYYSDKLTAVFGRLYTLLIQYRGKSFIAQSGSVPVEPLTPLQYQRASENYYRLLINDSGGESNYVDHSISWSNTPLCLAGNPCEGRVVYYDLKTIDVNAIFKPDQTDFVFPEGTVVVRRKYSVSPGYKIFLRSLLSETEWRGGLFDVQRANVTTNLSDGAIGYFAVSSVVSDTTIIVKKP